LKVLVGAQQTTEPDIVAPIVRLLARAVAVVAAMGALGSPVRAGNEALLLIDAETGKVLQAENAT
jgi:D-alanyl-D-alanine carboxypeptidase